MPSPRQMPPRRFEQPQPRPLATHDGRSNLEHFLGFSDEQFREYMTSTSTGSMGMDNMLEGAEAMAQHAHPVVRLAAGWSFAEGAMYKKRPPDNVNPDATYPQRMAALDTAMGIWEEVDAGLAAEQQRATDREDRRRASDYFSLRLRTEAAKAAFPLMQTVVEWRGGQARSPETINRRAEETNDKVLHLAGVLRESGDIRPIDFAWKVRGLAAEHLAQMVLQNYRPEGQRKYLIVPASFRQDHNDDPLMRSDLVAVSTEGFHNKKLIQVTSEAPPETEEGDPRLFKIYYRRDLRVDPKRLSTFSLDTLLEQHRGRQLEVAVQQRLTAMGSKLGARLDAFQPPRSSRQRKTEG